MGALFLGIAGALHYKGRMPRLIAILTLLSGASLAGLVAEYLPGLTHMHLFGTSVTLITAVVTGIFAWEEIFKRNGNHAIRTPIIAFVFGVTAVLVFTFAANLYSNIDAWASSNVARVTNSGS